MNGFLSQCYAALCVCVFCTLLDKWLFYLAVREILPSLLLCLLFNLLILVDGNMFVFFMMKENLIEKSPCEVPMKWCSSVDARRRHTGPRIPLDVHSSLKDRMSIVGHSWLELGLGLGPGLG